MIAADGHSARDDGDGRAETAAAAAASPASARPAAAAEAGISARDAAAMLFTGEMYGLQLDHLAAVLGVSPQRARAVAAAWRARGYAGTARLGPGPAWTWLTRAGLVRCGLPYTAAPPALARLAHIRAVTAVRLALEATAGFRAAGAHWRGERRLRARAGGRVGLREHLPYGEVHWPDGAPVPWAGECWAIEAELTPKTVARTAAIMTDLLNRTGDYGGPASQARVPGRPPRHARVLYVCAPAARGTVLRARDTLGAAAARIEIRTLPPGGSLGSARPADPEAVDHAAADPAAAGPKPADPRPADPRPADAGPADARPADAGPAGPRPGSGPAASAPRGPGAGR
ncbi:MAG: hypothetical protein ACLP7J_20150 [Streptosporangiaceae bacterium]